MHSKPSRGSIVYYVFLLVNNQSYLTFHWQVQGHGNSVAGAVKNPCKPSSDVRLLETEVIDTRSSHWILFSL